MIITKLELTAFGKFSNTVIELKSGLNLIEGTMNRENRHCIPLSRACFSASSNPTAKTNNTRMITKNIFHGQDRITAERWNIFMTEMLTAWNAIFIKAPKASVSTISKQGKISQICLLSILCRNFPVRHSIWE
jgi:hypothetical protein